MRIILLNKWASLPDAVADGMLRLQGEEEARREVFDGGSTRHKTLVCLSIR